KALDTAINWIVTKAKSLFASLFSGKKDKPDDRTEEQKHKDKQAGIAEAQGLVSKDKFDESGTRAKLGPIKTKYRLSTLDLVVDSKTQDKETIHFTASASETEAGSPITVDAAEDGQTNIKIERPEFRRSLKTRFRTKFPDSHVAGVLADNVDR